jgi:hypothetical protein
MPHGFLLAPLTERHLELFIYHLWIGRLSIRFSSCPSARQLFASNDFLSETTGPIESKFGWNVPWGDLYQVCSNCSNA